MITIARLAVLLALLALPAAVRAEEGTARRDPQPYELVRELRIRQDQTAAGITSAHAEQRALIARISAQLLNADPKVWSDPKNVRAAVIFVLSGGEPRVLKSLFAIRNLPGVDDKLLNGALAYSEGRNAEAAELLKGIDARKLEPALGGHVALVQGNLVAARDPAAAIERFDEARLLSPGTLVEEAALRREVFIVAATGDLERFERLAADYLRRFSHSVYAGTFRDQFAAELASDRYTAAKDRLPQLEKALADLPPVQRRDLYLAIAVEAVVKARIPLARLAARNATSLSGETGREGARAKVYEAAALVVTDEYDKAVADMETVTRAGLSAGDAALLEAARSVAKSVRRWPEAFTGSAPPAPPERAGAAPARDVVALARKSIAAADDVLGETDQ